MRGECIQLHGGKTETRVLSVLGKGRIGMVRIAKLGLGIREFQYGCINGQDEVRSLGMSDTPIRGHNRSLSEGNIILNEINVNYLPFIIFKARRLCFHWST